MVELGLVGLGRMGANMVRRLVVQGGHRVVVYNRTTEKAHALADELKQRQGGDGGRRGKGTGATSGEMQKNQGGQGMVVAVDSLEGLAAELRPPRVVWTMVPAGDATQKMIDELSQVLSRGDTIVDGGNSHYTETVRRARETSAKGFNFVDVGTSGGIWGLEGGYSLMVGGDEGALGERLKPILETLAPGKDKGWGWVGPSGAGHFVKMVHNGIEYGMMEAYAEGFEVLRAKEEFHLDLHSIAEIWRYGSVVRSWLLDLASAALSQDQSLHDIKGWVEDSGEGRWTVQEAIQMDVPAPVIALSLMMRFASRQDERYGDKLLAALRNQFGGHEMKKENTTTRATTTNKKKLQGQREAKAGGAVATTAKTPPPPPSSTTSTTRSDGRR